MKRIALLLLLLIIFPSRSSSLIEEFEGTWSTQIDNGNYYTYTETSYFHDGRKCTIFIDYNADTSKVTYANGGWKIEGNDLIIWTDDTNDKYIPVNKPSIDTIMKITDKELHIRPKNHGKTQTEVRFRVFENRGDRHCKLAPNKSMQPTANASAD